VLPGILPLVRFWHRWHEDVGGAENIGRDSTMSCSHSMPRAPRAKVAPLQLQVSNQARQIMCGKLHPNVPCFLLLNHNW
jgi:hypothetical protein